MGDHGATIAIDIKAASLSFDSPPYCSLPPLDLSEDGVEVSYLFTSPSLDVTDIAATIDDGENGLTSLIIPEGLIDAPGTWRVSAVVTSPQGRWTSKGVCFVVY